MSGTQIALILGGVAVGPLLERAITTTMSKRGLPEPSRRSRGVTSVSLGAGTATLEAIAVFRLGANWLSAPVACMFAGLVGLAWCDLRHFVLPKRIQCPMAAGCVLSLVIAAAMTEEWHRLLVAMGCGAAIYALFLVFNLVNPAGLGYGDVRLAGLIGLVLGWLAVARFEFGFIVSSVAGALAALALLAWRRQRSSRLPYGVFLAFGAIVAIIA